MRLLLVEDDLKLADFIRKGFAEAGFAVDWADNGIDGLHLTLTETYDVVVMDLMLPGLDGLAIINKMRQSTLLTPVIVLSAKRELDDRIKGLQTGADDYLVKPFSFAELLVRVQSLIRRATGTPLPTGYIAGNLTMDFVSHKVTRNGIQLDLQPKEFSLLQLFMQNKGRVLSKTMILEHIWDYHFDPQTNVVDVLVYRLRKKIDIPGEQSVIQTLRGVGYIFKNDSIETSGSIPV